MSLTDGYCYRSIRLPLPPSANDLVRPALMGRRARLVSTKAAKDFRRAAHAVLDALQRNTYGQLSPETGPVRLIAHFFVTSVASDVSNRVKALEDALSGYAWVDDKQVSEVQVFKRFSDDGETGCVVYVERAQNDALRERLEKGEARAAKAKRTEAAKRFGVPSPAVYR